MLPLPLLRHVITLHPYPPSSLNHRRPSAPPHVRAPTHPATSHSPITTLSPTFFLNPPLSPLIPSPPMASSLRPFVLSLPKPPLPLSPSLPYPPLPFPLRRRRLPPRLLSCRSSSTTTAPLEKPKRGGGGEARIRVRLDHQVAFGESVTLLGSTKELGSWTRGVPMEWTEEGWVCEVKIRGGETPEFKFVVVSGGEEKSLAWEDGGNRVLKAPDGGGVFDLVCHWNRTNEIAELSAVGEVEDEVVERVEGGEVVAVEGELSPFVEQWQGKDISFMRSNEHGGRESGRRWDTDGLDGVPLRLVEGDRGARNWWRKVHL